MDSEPQVMAHSEPERIRASGPPNASGFSAPSDVSDQSHLPVVGMEDFSPEDRDPRPLQTPPLRRVLQVIGILALLAALIFVPPLVSMNHYRRQIASSISASLGRPVRIDSVTLNLLPMPGFTLQNFIVGEDPAFGSEPIIRANSVSATLRFHSLWRRRVEFSRILLDAPSVNLVRLPDGRWNLQSILLRASHVRAAPTAQRAGGDTPRFPYIEATGARVNLKFGSEKLPISLTDATFALWLPQPDSWNLRLAGHPARTDTAATDTGMLRLEGSLGRGPQLNDIPINLTASWLNAPLGAASWIILGRDAGVRGELALRASAKGIAGDSAVTSQLELTSLRRAEFVPDHQLSADVHCTALATRLFHRLDQIRCLWPTGEEGGGLTVEGTLPDVTEPTSARGDAVLANMPADNLLNALKAASARVDRNLHASGNTYGHIVYGEPAAPVAHAGKPSRRARKPPPSLPVISAPTFSGTLGIKGAGLSLNGSRTFVNSDISATLSVDQLVLAPFPVNLGATSPALLGGHFDRSGSTLHLTGPLLRSHLAHLARSLPQFGDGLPASLLLPPSREAKAPESVLRVDLDAVRTWHGGQTWTSSVPAKPAAHRRAHRAVP